ncbi:hypothetical protein AAZV13_07G052450 [Glycine max]
MTTLMELAMLLMKKAMVILVPNNNNVSSTAGLCSSLLCGAIRVLVCQGPSTTDR